MKNIVITDNQTILNMLVVNMDLMDSIETSGGGYTYDVDKPKSFLDTWHTFFYANDEVGR
jgi:hypothetical protein